MNNLETFIKNLYQNFRQDREVLSLIGYIEINSQYVVESVNYFTSHDLEGVTEDFKNIVKSIMKYGLVARRVPKFVLVHNHPQGTEQPSVNDRKMKERIKMVSKFMGVGFVGSFIYIAGRDRLISVKGLLEIEELSADILNPSIQAVSNNLFYIDGRYRNTADRGVIEFNKYEKERKDFDWYGKQLNSSVLDNIFTKEGGSKLGLVALDDSNRIINVLDTNDMVEDISEYIPKGMSIKKVSFFLEEAYRYLLYDMRTDKDLEELEVGKDDMGLAEDTLVITKLMGIAGYPFEYFMH